MTKQQADEMLKELRQIRQLLEKQQAKPAAQPQEEQPTRAKITDLSGVSMLGSKTAPLTIVEYTDYQCPFCQRFHVTAFAELKKNYIDTGKVRFLQQGHAAGFPSERDARGAGGAVRGGAEEVLGTARHDGREPRQAGYGPHRGIRRGPEDGLGGAAACVDSGKYKDPVQRDVLEAMKVGANGTPTFVVGKSVGDGVDGELVVGAMPFQMFDAKLKGTGEVS